MVSFAKARIFKNSRCNTRNPVLILLHFLTLRRSRYCCPFFQPSFGHLPINSPQPALVNIIYTTVTQASTGTHKHSHTHFFTKALSAILHIHELTDAHSLLALTGETEYIIQPNQKTQTILLSWLQTLDSCGIFRIQACDLPGLFHPGAK